MSTASPLPLQPLPPSTLSEDEARALKQEVAAKLAEHRRRKPRASEAQSALPLEGIAPAPRNRIANSVAARFSKRVSYRDYLQLGAEAAIHQAEAEAEVARRTADAIVAAQQQLLEEIEDWNEGLTPEPDEPFTMTAPEPSSRHRSGRSAAKPHENAQQADAIAAPEITAAARLLEQFPPEPLEPAVGLPTNLIEFPRQLVAARKARPRLAEGPLREEADAAPERAQLRIFEVETSAVSTEPVIEAEAVLPEWHDIRLDAQDYDDVTLEHRGQEISFAPPILVAKPSLRAMAAVVDGCCIATSFLLAVAAAAYVSPVLPTGLPAVLASAATLFALWLFYQLLFFSVSDATPGMRYARIGLCTFSDENPTRAAMLKRIGARLLAGMPLGLGLLWACMDNEGLGWHDRMSRIYPRAY